VRVAFVLAAFLLLAPLSRGDDLPLLIGTVGPGFTIVMTDANGTTLDVVTAGRYQLLVHDESDIHNFVLGKKETGERAASTEVEFVGDETFTVDLTPGHWVYACSPHFQTMFGSFVVVPAATPPATPPTAVTRTMRATLTATGARLSATRATAGPYAITVTDRSRTRGFRLIGPGLARQTGKAFVGTVTWHVRLVHGTYRYGTDVRLSGRLTVS
jgi:hypothetical protein